MSGITIEANCWTGGRIGSDELSRFASFDVSPVRNAAQEGVQDVANGETWITRCATWEAEFWTVYGRTEKGMADALHDCETPEAAAEFLIGAMRLCGEKPVGYSSAELICAPETWCGLVDTLATEMARLAESKGAPDDPEGMAEAMEREPLSAVHEAFAEVAPGAQSVCGGLGDLFRAFGEWASAADEVAFADL